MQQYSGVLQINLLAIRENWQLLRANYSGGDCGAVIKANAYGLGVAQVAPCLFLEGCRTFFVASYQEGLELKRLLPKGGAIYVLQGCVEGMEHKFVAAELIPVLISHSMYLRWVGSSPSGARCAIKVNTGMNRLGMSLDELHEITKDEIGLKQAGVELVVSHLACADEPVNPLNQKQLEAFHIAVRSLRRVLPNVRASLVNSAGVFLGEAWQFDVARPGIALFGGGMSMAEVPKFSTVVSLLLPVLQVRSLDAGERVGYGGDFQAEKNMQIAIVAGGYADGVLRSLSGISSGWFKQKVPLLGRVSMDSCVFDVTSLPEEDRPVEGSLIEVIGEHCQLDDVAAQAGTLAYELLTRLGNRLQKQYQEE